MILLALTLLSCAARQGPISTRDRAPRGRGGKQHAGDVTGLGLQSAQLAVLPAGAFGPYLASSGGSRLVAWAVPEGNGSEWMTLPLGSTGTPQGEPLRIGEVPSAIGLVALRPAGGGGFVLLWTHGVADATSLTVARLGTNGELSGAPVSLGTEPRPFLWIDAVATKQGTVVLWAQPGDGEARLVACSLDSSGRPRGGGATVVEHALAWQAVAVPEGVAVVAVQRAQDRGARGTVVVKYLGRDGSPALGPVAVSESVSARPDVDAVAVPGGLLVAWTDLRDGDPTVYMAGLDGAGSLVSPPHRATPGLQAEAFVRLLATSSRRVPAYLVWEVVDGHPAEGGRSLRVAPVSGEWKLGPDRAALHVASNDELPELVATARGVYALTLAAACPAAGECPEGEPVPFFVELDPRLEGKVAQPLRLAAAKGTVATAAWNLSCTSEDCVALAAASGVPTPVHAVYLGDTGDRWRSPAHRLEAAQRPLPVSLHALRDTEPLSDVAMTPVGENTLVAWLTYFDPTTPYERPSKPAPDGRWAPVRATLWVSRLEGDELTKGANITYRARSLGGIALSPSTERDEALLAWSALDQGRPQVFLTLLGSRGQREAQQMFTHSAGEVSDVALARVDDGWIVGWVDERNDDPEIYVAKVDRTLRRQGTEQRLTDAPGVATGLQLMTRGDEVVVVWADARNEAKPGWSDIYATRISAKDAKPLGEARRLVSSRGHSHSPSLAGQGSSVVVGWLDGPGEGGDPPAGVSLARLDAQARFEAPPTRVVAREGTPTSLTLDCDTDRCHVVVSFDTGSSPSLKAFNWIPGQSVRLRALRTLPGASGQPVPSVLLGSRLLYADQPAQDSGRLNLMGVDW